MLLSKRYFNAVCVVTMLGFLTACSSLNEGFEALKDLTNTPDEQISKGAETNGMRTLAVDQFKQTQKPLSAEQQALLVEAQPLILKGTGNASRLKAMLDVLEASTSDQSPSIMLLALGDGYHQLELSEKAVSSWQQSLIANSFNYFAHDRLAQHYRKLGDFIQAEKHYSAALDAWPDFAEGYRNRGILYDLYLGDKASALADYQSYRQLLVRAGDETREIDRWLKEVQRAISQ